ncbi:MAG: iron-containing alcohol dehydrogenase, partial [Clostridia bacterium]|nr:iron-containing alcohol dehydrogenase [Clostridia bacterium]
MNIEYKNENGRYPIFEERVKGKKIAVVYDVNTAPYANAIIADLEGAGCEITPISFPDKELIPDEKVVEKTTTKTKGTAYLLAVGSGSLNDVAKKVSTDLGIECGVLATAASMDGYCSKGSALMQGGFKITFEVHTPSDVLIDPEIIRNAPRDMTASGFGDIVGKITCLTDWKMAKIVKGEEIHQKAYEMMEQARATCMDA